MSGHSSHRGTTKPGGAGGYALIAPRQIERFSKVMDKAERKAEQRRLVAAVKARILQCNLTQSAIANQLGVSSATISTIMADSPTCLPSIPTLERLLGQLQ